MSSGGLIYRLSISIAAMDVLSLGSPLHSEIGALLLAPVAIDHPDIAMMARRCDWHPQFEESSTAVAISHFHQLSGFSLIFFTVDLSFTAKKKGGSTWIGVVLVHQNGSKHCGPYAPLPSININSKAGPICHIK